MVGAPCWVRARVQEMDAAAPLLGALPELDSMAVANLITALEEHFDIAVEDDEISGSTFETLGSLTSFVERKLAA
jgi:acyl carrier protein